MGVKGGTSAQWWHLCPTSHQPELFVHAQELHAFKVPGQEPFTRIKVHVVSLEDIAPEHRFSSAWHATLGRCWGEALTMLAVTDHILKVSPWFPGTSSKRQK